MKDCTLFKIKKSGEKTLAKSKLSRLGMFAMLLVLTSFSFGQTVTTTFGTGEESSIYIPIRGSNVYSYSQQIYLATDFDVAVQGQSNRITKIRFYHFSNPGNFANSNNWTVYMGSTAQTQFASTTDWVPLANMQQVFTGILPDPVENSWVELTLATPFQWNGVSNVVVAVDENKAGSGIIIWRTQGTSPNRSMSLVSNSENPDPASLSAATGRYPYAPQAQFVHEIAPCSGTPAPGNTLSSLASACPGENFTLSLQNSTIGSGVTHQWQSSPNGTTWTNINGATAASLLTSQTIATYYRCLVNCMTTIGISTALQVNSNVPVYATLPVTEGFESWSNACGGTTNVPGSSWLTTPSTGNNSWRREDQGASASWYAITDGMYTPAFSQGTHSARFHTESAPNNAEGKLDLYVNCSAGNPEKKLTFDYINADGEDKLRVLISTDGGQNFTQVGADILTASTWTSQSCTFTSLSATTVVRLLAISDNEPSDIGVDNFNLQAAAVCNIPTALTVGGLTATAANLSWTAPTPAPTGGYEYVLSTTNTTPTAGGTSISATVYNASALVPNTNYYFFVRAACGSGSFSGWASIPFKTMGTSGVEDLEAILGLSIFPNPAGEMITVTVNESTKVKQISLRNITGALILSVKATGNKETFSLAQLAAGAYLMEIETDRGTLTKQFHVIH